MKRSLILLFFVIHCATVPQAKYRSSILFVTYDAGETLAIMPVLKTLDEKQVPYKILSFSASRQYLKDSHQSIDMARDCQMNLPHQPEGWPREKILDPTQLDQWNECVRADITLTGMGSAIQNQLGHLGKIHGKRFIAYYDSLSPLAENPTSLTILKNATETWVPSEKLLPSFDSFKTGARLKVMGQPTLDEWRSYTVDRNAILEQIPGTDKSKPILLYAGQYGDGYREAFALFARVTKNWKNYNLWVSLHPNSDGSLEKEVLREVRNNKIVILPKTFSTKDIAILSEVVVSRNSTVGVQALFAGKKSIFLDNPDSKLKNISDELGLAKRVYTPEAFSVAVNEDVTNKDVTAVYRTMYIPMNGAKIMADELMRLLK